MSKDKVRIRLKSFDHRSVDQACSKIVETVKRTGGVVSGPVPLPTEIEKITILRAVHKYKDSREQFEIRTHKRLIDIDSPSKETIDALAHIDLPSGVDIQIKNQSRLGTIIFSSTSLHSLLINKHGAKLCHQ